MKLNKIKLKEDMKLVEGELIDSDSENIFIQDIDSSSTSTLATKVNDAVVAATDGDSQLTSASASSVAQEIKKTAAEIETDKAVVIPEIDAPLGTQNELTKALDMCLRIARRNMKNKEHFGANLLVTGLPGSAKTAIVYEWAARNGINLKYIDAKNNELHAYINGYPLAVDNPDKPGEKVVQQVYSNALADLHKPNSVIFLDELNRQLKEPIRASLLSLINEKYDGRGKGSEGDFSDTLLFTIACINPAVGFADPGAGQLNQAELSRFLMQVNLNPNVDSARDYYKKYFDHRISIEVAKLKANPANKEALEELERYLKEEHLGLFIVNDIDFEFDGEDKVDSLYSEQRVQLNQRSLTDLLNMSGGDKDEMIYVLQHFTKFDPDTTEMLLKILEKYVQPTFDELKQAHKLTQKLETNVETEPVANTEVEVADQEVDQQDKSELAELEDDTDLFAGASIDTSGIKHVSQADIKAAIKTAIDTLVF